MLRYLLTSLFIVVMITSFAQSRRKKAKKEETAGGQPTSLAPFYPQKELEPKKKKRPTGKVTYDARDKYYDRMEDLEKALLKQEKQMQKPEYSDPMYFGHKRPPKKRPVNKMKYCRVCGIRH